MVQVKVVVTVAVVPPLEIVEAEEELLFCSLDLNLPFPLFHSHKYFLCFLGLFYRKFLVSQCISQRAVWTSLEKQLDPRGPIASRGWSIPEFLRIAIATCDFPWGSGPPVPTLCNPPMQRKKNYIPMVWVPLSNELVSVFLHLL